MESRERKVHVGYSREGFTQKFTALERASKAAQIHNRTLVVAAIRPSICMGMGSVWLLA